MAAVSCGLSALRAQLRCSASRAPAAAEYFFEKQKSSARVANEVLRPRVRLYHRQSSLRALNGQDALVTLPSDALPSESINVETIRYAVGARDQWALHLTRMPGLLVQWESSLNYTPPNAVAGGGGARGVMEWQNYVGLGRQLTKKNRIDLKCGLLATPRSEATFELRPEYAMKLSDVPRGVRAEFALGVPVAVGGYHPGSWAIMATLKLADRL